VVTSDDQQVLVRTKARSSSRQLNLVDGRTASDQAHDVVEVHDAATDRLAALVASVA
jgi:hypothetical protein